MEINGRFVFRMGERLFVYVSNHPLEERVVELTDDYRLDSSTLLLPELLAWDGGSTFGGEDES